MDPHPLSRHSFRLLLEKVEDDVIHRGMFETDLDLVKKRANFPDYLYQDDTNVCEMFHDHIRPRVARNVDGEFV